MSLVRMAAIGMLAASSVSLAQSVVPAGTIEWKRITLPFDTAGKWWPQPVWLYNPATRSTFVGANSKGLFESKDGGDSWIRVDDGSFVTSSVNTAAYTLVPGPNGMLYSIDISSGVYTSDNAGKHWTKAFALSNIGSRVWIDQDRPGSIYLLIEKATESEPVDTYTEFRHSTNAGASFDQIDVPLSNARSVDVAGRLICYAGEATISCSENATTWRSLSLSSIEELLAADKERNSSVEITINKANHELVIVSGGVVFETGNARTVIAPKVGGNKIHGRTIDLVFDPDRSFPAYGISGLDTSGPWSLARITVSGEAEFYPGPKATGFRLVSVDLAHDTFFVWTSEGFYRGVLK